MLSAHGYGGAQHGGAVGHLHVGTHIEKARIVEAADGGLDVVGCGHYHLVAHVVSIGQGGFFGHVAPHKAHFGHVLCQMAYLGFYLERGVGDVGIVDGYGLDAREFARTAVDLETDKAALLAYVGDGGAQLVAQPVLVIGKLGGAGGAGIGVALAGVVIVNAVGRHNVHAAVAGIVVGAVDAPVLCHHVLGVVVMVDEQAVVGYVGVPTGLLTIFEHVPLKAVGLGQAGLRINIGSGVGGHIVERDVLGLVELLEVGLFHPAHLQALKGHEAGRGAAVVVVTARGVEAVGAGIDADAAVVVVGVVHILEAEYVAKLVYKGADTVHLGAGGAHEFGRYRIVVDGDAVNLYREVAIVGYEAV